MAATTSTANEQDRPPLWRNERFLRIAGQLVAVTAVGYLCYWLFGNLTSSLDEQNISLDFGVVNKKAEFAVRDDPGFDPASKIFPNLIWVGIKNTAMSSVVGIAIAVVLGTLIGIGRLSSNWIVSKLAMAYVELFRNIPPLVIIVFFGFAVFTYGPFPPFNASSAPWQFQVPFSDNNFLMVSNDRSAIPSFATDGSTGIFWVLVILALVAAIAVARWRTSINVQTGEPHRRILYFFGTLLAITAVAYFITGSPYRVSWPSVSENGRAVVGGFATNAGYLSLTIALGLYTASHIAEIMRGSILAVAKGQTEASNALALSGFQRYRYVVLPQAMRIALPPATNQFLNLTKNTSLATVVAYPDITSLMKTVIGNGNPAIQFMVVLMAVYLVFSIFWSVTLNYVNSRMQLVGR